MNTTKSLSINDLIFRAAAGDSAASNVLDMIDANENGARDADGEQLARWYNAGVEAENERRAEAKRAEEHAEYARKIAARKAADRAVLAPAIAAVRALGVEIDDDGDVTGAPSADLSVDDELVRVTSWRSATTGKKLIVVGRAYRADGSQPVRFPLRKSGTYNVERIAELVKERVEIARAAAARGDREQNAQRAANVLAETVRQGLPARFSQRVEAVAVHSYSDGRTTRQHVQTPAAGKVFLNLGRLQLTPEQVARVVAALNEALPGDEL